MEVVIGVDDPRRDDVAEVLVGHLREMQDTTPAEGVFAFDVDALAVAAVRFYSARAGERVVAVGALHGIGDDHVEIKSMHTVAAVRGQGIARAMLDHLVDEAARLGYARVSLETGNSASFAPARALYRSAGFDECDAFGPYVGSATSTCMTRML